MLVFFYFIVGSCFGSFCCVLAERIPQQISIIMPASFYPYCTATLSWREKIPILSILHQRFSCRHCRKKLPLSYFWAELLAGGIFCFVGLQPRLGLFHLIWLLSALTLSLTDHFYYLVEPKIFYPSMMLLITAAWITVLPIYWLQPLVIFLSGWLLYRLMPESFGGGDVLLIAGWSLFLTARETAFLICCAALTGILYFLWRKLKRQPIKELPFVPFLSFGLFITMLFF